ncbi:MAG: hypothetical protein AAF363_17525 [Bacteroidota bacterium]
MIKWSLITISSYIILSSYIKIPSKRDELKLSNYIFISNHKGPLTVTLNDIIILSVPNEESGTATVRIFEHLLLENQIKLTNIGPNSSGSIKIVSLDEERKEKILVQCDIAKCDQLNFNTKLPDELAILNIEKTRKLSKNDILELSKLTLNYLRAIKSKDYNSINTLFTTYDSEMNKIWEDDQHPKFTESLKEFSEFIPEEKFEFDIPKPEDLSFNTVVEGKMVEVHFQDKFSYFHDPYKFPFRHLLFARYKKQWVIMRLR